MIGHCSLILFPAPRLTLLPLSPFCVLQSVSLVNLKYSPEKMSILFSQNSSSLALSLKILLISTSVLSAAVLLKLSVPAIADFAVTDVPSMYNVVVSWLRPPYLYLVINCIIITIVASSKLQSKVGDMTLSPSPAPPLEATSVPVHPQPVVIFPEPVKQYGYDTVTVNGDAVEAVKLKPEVFEYTANSFISNGLNHYETMVSEADEEFLNVNAAVALTDVEINNYSDEVLVPKSSPSPSPIGRRDSSDFSFSNEKPPVSKRIGQRRAVKASPEGGKVALGVSKSKRQDTLESTWKTITEGRAMPLTRHLRKSDTWETHGGRHHNQTSENQMMMKSETFKDGNNSLLSPSPGSGKLKKEPSLGQDELNRRVEAFIKKFNEEMRLQRQESLNQYTEMINRGAH